MKDSTTKEKSPVFEMIKDIIIKNDYNLLPDDVQKINPSEKICDYLDSLDYVEVIVSIEKQLNIAIPDEECNEHITFQDMINSVIKHQK